MPEPKKGQWQYDLFTELYGKEFDEYDTMILDPEEKITEFNYENYIPKLFLE